MNEDTKKLAADLGAADWLKIDEYLYAVPQIEQKGPLATRWILAMRNIGIQGTGGVRAARFFFERSSPVMLTTTS